MCVNEECSYKIIKTTEQNITDLGQAKYVLSIVCFRGDHP